MINYNKLICNLPHAYTIGQEMLSYLSNEEEKLINYKNSPEMLKYNVLIYLDCSSKYKDCING